MEVGADPLAGELNAIGRTDLLGVLGARETEGEDTSAVPSGLL
jgi:hypothetical protein